MKFLSYILLVSSCFCAALERKKTEQHSPITNKQKNIKKKYTALTKKKQRTEKKYAALTKEKQKNEIDLTTLEQNYKKHIQKMNVLYTSMIQNINSPDQEKCEIQYRIDHRTQEINALKQIVFNPAPEHTPKEIDTKNGIQKNGWW